MKARMFYLLLNKEADRTILHSPIEKCLVYKFFADGRNHHSSMLVYSEANQSD